MAARQSHYIAIKNETGEIAGLYIATTEQRALAHHTLPLTAKKLSVEEANELLENGMRAIRVPKDAA